MFHYSIISVYDADNENNLLILLLKPCWKKISEFNITWINNF